MEERGQLLVCCSCCCSCVVSSGFYFSQQKIWFVPHSLIYSYPKSLATDNYLFARRKTASCATYKKMNYIYIYISSSLVYMHCQDRQTCIQSVVCRSGVCRTFTAGDRPNRLQTTDSVKTVIYLIKSLLLHSFYLNC